MDIRAELKDLMESKNYSIAYVSTATGIAKSTISMWMNGNYNGKNDKITDAINNFIQREHERSGNSDLPFVDISTVKYITEIGRLCHTQGKIGVCVGKAGLGKTVAVKRYTKEFMDSILIESDSGYTAKSLLKEIHRRLGLSGKGSVYDLMDEVVRKLNQSGRGDVSRVTENALNAIIAFLIRFGILKKPVLNAFKPFIKLAGIAFIDVTVQSFSDRADFEIFAGSSVKVLINPFLISLSIRLISALKPNNVCFGRFKPSLFPDLKMLNAVSSE